MGLKLEVGKEYRTRGGWKAKVISCAEGEEQPFCVHHDHNDFASERHHNGGEYYIGCLEESDADLVAEWSEPSTAAPPIPDTSREAELWAGFAKEALVAIVAKIPYGSTHLGANGADCTSAQVCAAAAAGNYADAMLSEYKKRYGGAR